MQFFYWVILLIVAGIAVFTIQNSNLPPVMIKFLIWRVETSLIYTIFGSLGAGVLIGLLFLVPNTIRSSLRLRELKRQNERYEASFQKSSVSGEGGHGFRE